MGVSTPPSWSSPAWGPVPREALGIPCLHPHQAQTLLCLGPCFPATWGPAPLCQLPRRGAAIATGAETAIIARNQAESEGRPVPSAALSREADMAFSRLRYCRSHERTQTDGVCAQRLLMPWDAAPSPPLQEKAQSQQWPRQPSQAPDVQSHKTLLPALACSFSTLRRPSGSTSLAPYSRKGKLRL